MDYKHVVETWLYYGVGDLFFAHYLNHGSFEHHRAFFGITSVEKHFKALLLYHRRACYENLPDEGENSEGQKKVQKIAIEYSHGFVDMVNDIETLIAGCGIKDLIADDYELPVREICEAEDWDVEVCKTYNGTHLLEILQKAYSETRYPTDIHRRVFQEFPIGENNEYFFDPLSSAGFHKFTQTLCEFVINQLNGVVNVDRVLIDVTNQYEGLDSFRRFRNLFLKNRWPAL